MVEIQKDCSTCEWGFGDEIQCAAYLKRPKKAFSCWNCGFSYFMTLIDSLPEKLKREALDDPYSDAWSILEKYYSCKLR